MSKTSWFTHIGAALGIAASLFTVVGFLSVKPLPRISAKLPLDWCSKSEETRNLLERVIAERGNVVYLDFQISADITNFEKRESEPDQESDVPDDQPACGTFNLGNMVNDGDQGGLVSGIRHRDFFSAPYQWELVPEGRFKVEDRGESYDVSPELILPNGSQLFVQVNYCESHCYDVEGPVLIKEFFATEGILGLGLVPVDVHQNAYLNSRYECRLNVDRSKIAFLGWLQCLF